LPKPKKISRTLPGIIPLSARIGIVSKRMGGFRAAHFSFGGKTAAQGAMRERRFLLPVSSSLFPAFRARCA
jgi:hypothetical protein